MIRKKRYIPEQILPHIIVGNDRRKRMVLDGDSVKICSLRLATFKKSIVCAGCGLKGRYFVKKRGPHDIHFHLELYGIDKNLNEVLMTKDHIIPSSKGGKNHTSNLQTMCRSCNVKKGNS